MGFLTITKFPGIGGGGGRYWIWNPVRKTGSKNQSGNDLVIMGPVVVLLIVCFVSGCGGKPFHSAGQAEVEEDTTQNSLKEKFPDSLALAIAHDESLIHSGKHPVVGGLLLGDSDVDSDDDGFSDGPLDNGAWQHHNRAESYSHYPMEKQSHHYLHENSNDNDNVNAFGMIGMVNKRSGIGIGRGGLPLSSLAGSSGVGNEDMLVQDEGFPRPARLRPESSPSSASSSDIINSSGEGTTTPRFRIRQKLVNLRNQYGDQWMALVGPYAYRKRQILYRQCFFNPISCF